MSNDQVFSVPDTYRCVNSISPQEGHIIRRVFLSDIPTLEFLYLCINTRDSNDSDPDVNAIHTANAENIFIHTNIFNTVTNNRFAITFKSDAYKLSLQFQAVL